MTRGFTYFVSGLRQAPPGDDLAKLGLDHAFLIGEPIQACEHAGGPGGQGVLLARQGVALEYKAAEQIWKQIGERTWLGIPKDPAARPWPEELQRRDSVCEGRQLVLGDGRAWTIPIIRFANGDTALPRVVCYDKGEAYLDVRACYRPLFQLAEKIVLNVLTGQGAEFPGSVLMALGAGALGVNYRVSPAEVGLLELLTTENVPEIARIALDSETWERVLKEEKKTKVTAPVS